MRSRAFYPRAAGLDARLAGVLAGRESPIVPVVRDTGVELWVAEVASGAPRPLTDASLNATWGSPCEWLPTAAACSAVFAASAWRSAGSARSAQRPERPESTSQLAPGADVSDLLSNPYDEALFEYHFESQLATVKLATGSRTGIGAPGLFSQISGAPDGDHLLVTRVKRPFSWQVPANRFPRSVEVWNHSGDAVELTDLPLADAVPNGGVPTGPRGLSMEPDEAGDGCLGGGTRWG